MTADDCPRCHHRAHADICNVLPDDEMEPYRCRCTNVLVAIRKAREQSWRSDAVDRGQAVSRYECEDCGVAAMDVPDVDPEFWFERDDDGVMRCGGCRAVVAADRRWLAGDW